MRRALWSLGFAVLLGHAGRSWLQTALVGTSDPDGLGPGAQIVAVNIARGTPTNRHRRRVPYDQFVRAGVYDITVTLRFQTSK